MTNDFITYKFYQRNGKRLTIKGQNLDNNKSQITIVACSKSDGFTKWKGFKAVESGEPEYHPKTINLDYPLTLKSFMDFCHSNFYWKTSIPVNLKLEGLTNKSRTFCKKRVIGIKLNQYSKLPQS
jgi:hypothetical protein